MTVAELLTQLSRIFFVAIFLLTLIDYLRHKDKIRRDIALMFSCIGAPVLIAVIRSIAGLPATWLAGVGAVILLGQPYVLLRLVRYFRPVPPLLEYGAFLSMIASWAAVITLGTPLPTVLTLAIVAYFVIIDGYAVFAFVQGAFSSAGVTRNRLRFAALGSALLVIILALTGARVAVPALSSFVTPFNQLLAILSALAYYLGFAPPRWLRQAWQNAELRDYLQNVQKAGHQGLPEIIDRLYTGVTRAMGNHGIAIALWDEKSQALALQRTSSSPLISDLPLGNAVQKAWQTQAPVVVYKTSDTDTEDAQTMSRLDIETMFIVPIATSEKTLGVLIVFLEYGSLFVDDDLDLLTIFAQQKAIFLENHTMVEELHHQAQDLEKKVQERTAALKRSNEELRQFAYVASHDLQEPLRMVTNYLELIETRYPDKLDDDGREFIGFAVDGAIRMKNLINDLLTYSRVETQIRDFTMVDCQKVFNDASKFLNVAITEAGASITHDPLPKIQADESLILQLFQNLISNAIKYRSESKPEIHISAVHQKGEWLFSIRDNGIGIEPEYLDRIFIIFQRLHNRGKYPGTGIGLAICKKAVELHNGRIWVESEFGKGSTFYFTIPA